MKVTLGDCFRTVNRIDGKLPLGELFAEKLPVATAIRLRKLVVAINKEVETADPERIKIFEEFKVPQDEKRNYDLAGFATKHPGKSAEFNIRIGEFMDVEVDIGLEKFDPGELGDITISMVALDVLSPFIKEE